jgi:tetratricopeptide (TPR) repeat protein
MGLQSNPENLSLRTNYAICLHALGRKEDALAQYNHVINDPDVDVNPLLRILAARIQAEKRNYGETYRLLKSCASLMSKEDSSFWNFLTEMEEKAQQKQPDENWFKTGMDYLNSGNFSKAVHCFHQVIDKDPEDADAWHGLGAGYHSMNLLFDAVRCYKKAIEIKPENAKLWYNLGAVHYSMNEYSEAVKCFVKATDIDPEYVDAWTWTGMTYGPLGDFKLAALYLEKASQLKPDEARIWYYLGQTQATLLDQAQNSEEKTKSIRTILQRFKNAEEKGIKKYLPEEEYIQFKRQTQMLINELMPTGK